MSPPREKNPRPGYWGTPTSTLDWCEMNYVDSYYIAEFWNTVSNLAMILPALFGMFYFYKKGFDRQYILSNASLFIVGIGSWMFHMTLIFEMQLLDELPMIYGTCVFLYTLRHRAKPYNYVANKYILVLFSICLFVTATYLFWKEPVFHQVSYGLLVFAVVIEAIKAMTAYPEIRWHVGVSLMSYIIGFALWNVDNIFCSSIRATRSTLPSAISPITQLHAWWHVFTGYGTYVHILFSAQVRALHFKRKCTMKTVGILPFHLVIEDAAAAAKSS